MNGSTPPWVQEADWAQNPAAIRYLINVVCSGSCFINSIAGGDYRCTTSERVGRAARKGSKLALSLAKVIDTLLLEDDHCRKAVTSNKYDMQVAKFTEED